MGKLYQNIEALGVSHFADQRAQTLDIRGGALQQCDIMSCFRTFAAVDHCRHRMNIRLSVEKLELMKSEVINTIDGQNMDLVAPDSVHVDVKLHLLSSGARGIGH